MCQLFALSSNVPTAVNFAFTGFSARGGQTGEHADGFGLAFHDADGCRVFLDADRACDSPLAEFLRRQPIRARQVLAHVRRATQGPVRLANCHPFVREWQGRHWTFCHNGDLQDFHPRLNGSFLPVGQTDSEHAFCWMLQELRRRFGTRRPPGWHDVAVEVARLARRIARHGRFNFLLCDGEALYAHASTRLFWTARAQPFPTVHLVDHDLSLDLSTGNAPDDRMVLVATEPLTRNEAWTPFAPGELQVIVAGRAVWRSVEAANPQAAPSTVRRPGVAFGPAG